MGKKKTTRNKPKKKKQKKVLIKGFHCEECHKDTPHLILGKRHSEYIENAILVKCSICHSGQLIDNTIYKMK